MSDGTEMLERRGSGRAATQRMAHVERRGGGRFSATLVEVGPLGLRLLCEEPLARGDALYIEVFSRDGASAPYAVRGVVRHAQRRGGQWMAGVQLNAGLPNQDADYPAANALRELEALRAAMAALDNTRASRLTFHLEEDSSDPAAPSEAPVRNSRPWRWATAAACALLLLLLLGGGGAMLALPRVEWRLWERSVVRADAPQEAAPPPLDYTPAEDPISLAWDSLDNPELLEALPPLPARAYVSPADEFVDAWLRTRMALGQGDRAAAQASAGTLERIIASGDAPVAWVPKAEVLLAGLEAGASPGEGARGGEAPAAEDIPRAALALDALPAGPGGDGEAPAVALLLQGVWLEVDLSEHTITLHHHDEPVKVFPVGLGAQGATPVGEFTIINRIANPDWYNRGNVVPHGDPRNPLGDYWMGIAAPGAPQGIGIHPTADEDSIGANRSRGCIRMFPDDARQLFGICRVGTKVRIHD
jgi:hypothetical protein